MNIRSFGRLAKAVIAVLFLLTAIRSAALAGTTGGVTGAIKDDHGTPIAGVKVTAAAPSAVAGATSDASGRFAFLTLPPDTYTVTFTRDGYQTLQEQGVTVIADQTIAISIRLEKVTKVLGIVPVRSNTSLVKPGVATISYSVTADVAAAANTATGNGYDQHNIYGLAQLVPGVVSNGGLHIRGSQPDQIAYEYDGVPVNRAFDLNNGSLGSTAGFQELQVYTGGGPASSAAESTGGFVNVVEKSGTYPGFSSLHTEFGTPAYDHVASVEEGGATPDRRFTWYFNLFGQNNTQRTFSQFDGAGIDLTQVYNPVGNSAQFLGAGTAICGADGSDPYLPYATGGSVYAYPPGGDPGCVNFAFPPLVNHLALRNDRDSVANVHFAIPHSRDSRRDDLQVLYTNQFQFTQDASSINDAGGLANMQFFNNRYNIIPAYRDSVVFAPGTQFGQSVSLNNAPQVIPYLFPSSPAARCANLDDSQGEGGGAFPFDAGNGSPSPYIAVHPLISGSCPLGVFSTFPTTLRDGNHFNFSLEKVGYTKSLSDTAYLKAWVYESFSNQLSGGVVSKAIHGTCCLINVESADYEQIFHKRGGALQYANQFSTKHLFTATANFSRDTGSRWNNQTTGNTVFSSATSLVSFDANGNPTCYNYQTGDPDLCDDPANAGGVSNVFGTNLTGSTAAGTYIDPTRSNPALCGPSGAFQYQCWDPTQYSDGGTNAPAALAGAKWIVTHLGPNGALNTVSPVFSTYAVQDQWSPNDRVAVNVGLRVARQEYDFLSSSQTPANDFWYSAYRQSVCYNVRDGQPVYVVSQLPTPQNPNPGTVLLRSSTCTDPVTGVPVPNAVHPDGVGGHFLLTDVAPPSYVNHTFEPNVGFTYTFNSDTVIRFHTAKSSDPVESAFTEYLNPEAQGVADENFRDWFGKGYFGTAHIFPPQTGVNTDFSYERHFKGTDLSTTISPFYKYYSVRYLPYGLSNGLASAYPGAREKISGIEVQLQKGSFQNNGISWTLNWTYTKNLITLLNGANGKNSIDGDNFFIDSYNALTAQGDRYGEKGAPCYNNQFTGLVFDPVTGGTIQGYNPDGNANVAFPGSCSVVNGQVVETPAALAAGDIVNTYYLMPAQPNEDKNGWYDSNYGGLTSWPNAFSGWINYRHKKLAVTPDFLILEGTTYGGPGDIQGEDPRNCNDNQAGFGSQGTDQVGNPIRPIPNTPNPGLPIFLTCNPSSFVNGGLPAIPNPQTGTFASPSQFRQPWSLFVGSTFTYNMTDRVTARLSASSLYHTCWGGSKTPWSDAYPAGNVVCGYQSNPYYVRNFFNGRSPWDVNANGVTLPIAAYPYGPSVGSSPLFAVLQVDVKL